MFKAGQAVVVVNRGRTYDTYNKLAEAMRLTKWKSRGMPDRDTVYKVLGSSPHLTSDMSQVIVAITDGGQDFLVGETGLELVNVTEMLEKLREQQAVKRKMQQELAEQTLALETQINELEALNA
jgi:hypothetical protein